MNGCVQKMPPASVGGFFCSSFAPKTRRLEYAVFGVMFDALQPKFQMSGPSMKPLWHGDTHAPCPSGKGPSKVESVGGRLRL